MVFILIQKVFRGKKSLKNQLFVEEGCGCEGRCLSKIICMPINYFNIEIIMCIDSSEYCGVL